MSGSPNKYPVYVISKGRWAKPLTAKALQSLGIPFTLVIEPQQLAQYQQSLPTAVIRTLPFSNLGLGSIPARNWVWEDALQLGHKRHWILDDNIDGFYRLNNNKKPKIRNENPFEPVERFVDRYENVALAGLNYEFLAPRREAMLPIRFNTRIYSCILILTKLTYRWRGCYNEDTDLSLRVLKDGWCTVLFNAYLAKKMPTMSMQGGNTDELYIKDAGFDGRLEMALSLQRQHPDVVKVTRKWGRWQHQVDYRPFQRNRLIPVKDVA